MITEGLFSSNFNFIEQNCYRREDRIKKVMLITADSSLVMQSRCWYLQDPSGHFIKGGVQVIESGQFEKVFAQMLSV